MKLSISNLAWTIEQNESVYKLMQKHGFTGLEIAPTKIFQNNPYSHILEAIEWNNGLKKNWGFEVSSMQSIWYGRKEKLFGSQEEERILCEYTKKAIDFASEIGCKNIVFGCPKNRNIPLENKKDECYEKAVLFFKLLGDYSESKNTCVGMEANPEIYGTNFLNTTSEVISFVKRVDSDGFKLNLDVGTMIQNNEDISVLQEKDLHRSLFRFLKTNNYNGFISIEMNMQNDINDIEDVLNYVRTLNENC